MPCCGRGLYAIAIYVALCIISLIESREVIAMSIGSVFVNNRTQAVRLPADTRFPDTIKKVSVRVVGQDRILSPVDKSWDSFFLSSDTVSGDFMVERASQQQSDREAF